MGKTKIVLDGGTMPVKKTTGAACFDLYAPDDFDLKSGRQVLDLGIRIQLPHNMAAIIKSRSGYASKGMEVIIDHWYGEHKEYIDADVLQGVIDADYRGHVSVIINVHTDIKTRAFIPKGTRIAQLQFVQVPQMEFEQVDVLDETERGDGGFGHTNKEVTAPEMESVEKQPIRRGRKPKSK
jgi:dUTP pyrophosphatase